MNIEPLQHTILDKVEKTTRELFNGLLEEESLNKVIETLELSVLNGFMAHGYPSPMPKKIVII
jgi:hypothetical protein